MAEGPLPEEVAKAIGFNMLVPADLSAWLKSEAEVDAGNLLSGGMVELTPEVADAIMSGALVSQILVGRREELQLGGAGGDNEVRLLKQVASQRGQGSGNAPSERLYSWNMLSPLLARLRVSLSADDKTLIVAGDEEVSPNHACSYLLLRPPVIDSCPCSRLRSVFPVLTAVFALHS